MNQYGVKHIIAQKACIALCIYVSRSVCYHYWHLRKYVQVNKLYSNLCILYMSVVLCNLMCNLYKLESSHWSSGAGLRIFFSSCMPLSSCVVNKLCIYYVDSLGSWALSYTCMWQVINHHHQRIHHFRMYISPSKTHTIRHVRTYIVVRSPLQQCRTAQLGFRIQQYVYRCVTHTAKMRTIQCAYVSK